MAATLEAAASGPGYQPMVDYRNPCREHKMTTKKELEGELHQAMRQGDDLRKRTLRMVLTAIKLAEVDRRGELGDDDVMRILQREAKSRQETIDDANRADRPDLVESAQAELDLLRTYLPEPLSDEQITELARKIIAGSGASGASDMGKVMGQMMPKVGGRADGKRVSQIVQGLLADQGS
jgi:uncharacterized protein YqeY